MPRRTGTADRFREANLALWDEWVGVHERSAMYDLAGFRKGRTSLKGIELAGTAPAAQELALEFLHEFPFSYYPVSPWMVPVPGKDRRGFPPGTPALPLLFSLKARLP